MSAAFNSLNSAHNANANGVNVTVNLNAAPLMAAAAHKGMAVPMSSPIADFSFLSDAFDLSGAGNAAAADAALLADPSTANALNALRRSAALAQAANGGAAAASAASVLPSPSPPLAMLGLYGDSSLPPLSALAPAAMNASSLMADDVPHNAAAAAAAALAAAQAAMPGAMAHPFALSYSAPGSPSLSLAGDATDPDSPSSIASDLSSASSLLTSAAASPRILASLPRHSSTPSLAALAAATPAFAAASPAAARAAPALPSLKPSLRQSNSKNNLVYLSAAPKAGVSLNSFSLAAAVNSAQADEDEQPSKKKQKANDASMRRVKSSPVLADDSDSDASDSDDDAPPAKGAAAAAAKAKGRKNPISLVNKDGKPKSEAEIKKEKAERRLAKKAEAARQSRKRKKAYVQQLEEKAAKLEARLAQLEGAAAAGAHAAPAHMRSPAPAAAAAAAAHQPMVPTPSAAAAAMVQATTLHALHREEQSEVLARLSKAVTQFVALATTQPPAVNPNAPGAAAAAAQAAGVAVKEKERLLEDIKALIERYVVNSRKRQQTVTYYLDRLAELMVPDAAVKVALWGLSQPDSYYAVAASADGKQSAAAAAMAQANANNQAGAAVIQAGAINAAGAGVFSALMAADVGLTTAQLSKLAADFRGPVSGVMDALKKSAAHVAELREHVTAHMVARNRHIDELRHILNPIQIANYLLWIERNPQLANRLSSSSGKNVNSANNSGAGSASAGSCQTGGAKGNAGGAGADGATGLGSGPNSPVVVTATAVPYAGVMGLSGLSGFAAYGGAHGK